MEVRRVKVYPVTDGTEFYLKASIYADLLGTARLNLIESRAEVLQHKKAVTRLVSERAKGRSDEPRVVRRVPGTVRDAPQRRRKQSEDALDQGTDRLVSFSDINPDSIEPDEGW